MPTWKSAKALSATVAWYHRFATSPGDDMHAFSIAQIIDFTEACLAAKGAK
jgi:hypothetical protein